MTRPLAALATFLLAFGMGLGAPEDRSKGFEDKVLASMQEARAAKGVAPLLRSAELDAAALARAEAVAARPKGKRMKRESSIQRFLEERGGTLFLEARERLDLQRGPGAWDPAALLARWRRHSGFKHMLTPSMSQVGLATAQTKDGWRVFIAVLAQPQDLPESFEGWETEIHTRINAIRAEYELPELTLSEELSAVARAHSVAMAEGDFFSHVDPAGNGPGARLQNAELRYLKVTENIAKNLRIPDPLTAAVQGWMKSPPHRKNILDESVAKTGVGIALSKDGIVYFTQVFVEER